MENESRKKKQASKKKEVSENRSPLQDLNGVSICRKNCWKSCTNSSLSSSSVSFEAPKGCLRSFVSSNSSSSSTSSSAKTVITRKPKPPLKFTNSSTQKSAAAGGRGGGNSKVLRSEENDVRRKHIPQNLRKNQPSSIYQRKINKKSTLSSTPRNPEKGFEKLGQKLKNPQEIGQGQSTIDNFTPAEKIACGSGLQFSNLDDDKNIRENPSSTALDSNSSASTKTPPVEASVSPEIQCGSHSKVLVSTAAVTPICYGAGHLISGVTDKRKCRSRGILTVGPENANLFEYGSNEGKVSNQSRASFVPMPAEASLHWSLSPCDEENEGNESDLEKKMENCRIITGNDSLLLDLDSSPSTFIGNASDFLCDSDSYGVDCNVVDIASTGKTRDVCLSPRRVNEIGGSGNVIQTPDSNSSIERHFKDYEHERRHLELEFESTEINQLPEKNMDKTSYVFDSLSENLSLSQLRISWMDGLVSHEMDEFDCCRCLSDEEVDAEGCSNEHLMAYPGTKTESAANKESGLRSPVLEGESYPSGKGKAILSPHGRNSCAESISTNGGGLIASGDSDWTICYKNDFF